MTTSRYVGSGYVIEDVTACVLGRGGSGTVYRALSRADGRSVAVKVLDESRLADAEVVTRFVRERDALVCLRHPSLVPVIDLVVEGNLLAIVMELVDGPDLRTQLDASGQLDPDSAALLLADVLPGLAVAHAAGIVHRDIKPENLLVERSTGRLRLTDFGIARLTLGTSVTRLTSILGTPHYMAPELAEHGAASAASDLYAIGILLYEMVAGYRPFTGGHPVAVLRKHIDEAPVRPEVMPDALWELVGQLLAKDPAERPQSAADVAARLRAFASRGPAVAAAVAPLPPVATPEAQVELDGTRPLEAWPPAVIADPAAPPVVAALPRSAPLHREETVLGSIPRPVADVAEPVVPAAKRRWLVPTAAAVAAVLALGIVGVTTLRDGEPRADAAATVAVQNVFPVQAIGDGVVATRTWTLSGSNFRKMRSSVEIINSSKTLRTGYFDDVIPKQIATDAKQITRLTPAEVVVADPVLRYSYGMKARERYLAAWEATVPASATQQEAQRKLDAWAAQQVKDDHGYLLAVLRQQARQVIRLKLLPGQITMPANGRAYVALSGRLANGRLANSVLLSSTTYESSNPNVVFVDRGLLTAVNVGTARVVARLGTVTATMSVRITPATATAPPPIRKAPVAAGFTNAATIPAAPTTRAAQPSPARTTAPATRTSSVAAPKPSPKPSPSPSVKPSPTPAPHTGPPTGTTYTAAVGTDAVQFSGATYETWTRYTSTGGNAARTKSSPSGCSGTANTGTGYVDWTLQLPSGAEGNWDVQVFIPGDAYRATHGVRYRIAVAGGNYVTKTIAQTSYRSQWATLFHGQLQSNGQVHMTNNEGWTGDCSQVQPINASTVRWVYRG